MIELPESQTLASQMNNTLRGKKVTRIQAGLSPHKFFFTRDGGKDYDALLRGKTLGETLPLGIYTETLAGDVAFLCGEGLNLRYIAPGEAPPQKLQLLIDLEDGSMLAGTVSMYGAAWVYPTGTFTNPYYLVAKEKPSPLTAAFDEGYFDAIVREAKPTLSAKGLLATEQRIPGLGNGTAQDILFLSGIHPKAKVSSLDDKKLAKLYKTLKETLVEMTRLGGRDTEKDLFGQPGGYKTLLSAKTWKNPCPVCGGEIQKQNFLGGSIYFCPTCQPV